MFFMSCIVTWLIRVVQALDLSKALARKRAVQMAQGSRVMELKADNALHHG
jgi:hypothetical protein